MLKNNLSLKYLGINTTKNIYRNLSVERLIEEELVNGEVVMGINGATIVDTGEYTGRSPNDKFFVEESTSKTNLWWGPVNRPVNEKVFNELYEKVIAFYNSCESKTYVFDGYAGAEKKNQLHLELLQNVLGKHTFAVICSLGPQMMIC